MPREKREASVMSWIKCSFIKNYRVVVLDATPGRFMTAPEASLISLLLAITCGEISNPSTISVDVVVVPRLEANWIIAINGNVVHPLANTWSLQLGWGEESEKALNQNSKEEAKCVLWVGGVVGRKKKLLKQAEIVIISACPYQASKKDKKSQPRRPPR